jgi:hypothetical protein
MLEKGDILTLRNRARRWNREAKDELREEHANPFFTP